jgi:hypothetical protein
VSPGDTELDLAPGPSLVRPYAVVGGRTRHGSATPLPVESIVFARGPVETTELRLEKSAIVQLCQRPYSLAEIAGRLSLPIGVVRVLVADLSTDGFVGVNLPLDPRAGDTMDRGLLERVLAGLEAL